MPQIDPTQCLMSALSTLTGGLVSDMQTLILGMVVLGFIAMGIDYLMDVVGHSIERASKNRSFERAKSTLAERDQYERGSAEYDRLSIRYRKLLNKSV